MPSWEEGRITGKSDAPLEARNLRRLAARAWLGAARTGSSGSSGSGDYVIAFSTASQNGINIDSKNLNHPTEVLTNDAMSPLFQPAIEATEEAIYNSLLRADTTTSTRHAVEALPRATKPSGS